LHYPNLVWFLANNLSLDATHETCTVFKDNLLSDNATQFFSLFAANLLSDYVRRLC